MGVTRGSDPFIDPTRGNNMDGNFEHDSRRPSEREAHNLKETLEQKDAVQTTSLYAANKEDLEKMELDANKDCNPFARRDSIKRTPPRQRTHSLPDLEDYGAFKQKDGDTVSVDGRPGKRRRADRVQERNWREGGDIGRSFRNIIESMCKHIRKMGECVGEMYKPKKELTDLTGKLLLQVEKLQSGQLKGWLEDVICGGKEEEEAMQALHDENLRLRKELLHAYSQKEKDELGVHCGECLKQQRKATRRQALSGETNFENFSQITEQDWEDEIFPKLQVEKDLIWNAPVDCQLILPCDSSIKSKDRLTERAIEKYGGRDGLKAQGRQQGEVAMMTHALGFPDAEGKFSSSARCIYYPVIINEGSTEDAKSEHIFQCMKTIRNHMLSNGKTSVVLPDMGGIIGKTLSRITEYIFAGTDVQVKVYRWNEKQLKARGAGTTAGTLRNSEVGGSTDGNLEPSKRRKPLSEAILIKMKDKSYAELLKTMKSTVDPKETGAEIKEIRKTKNGELLLTVRNGSSKAEALKKDIAEKIPGVTASLLMKRKVLHIRDLDEITTEEEVRQAVAKAISVKCENVDVRALRPAYRGKKNATVILAVRDADRLIHNGRVEVGWTSCRVLERREEVKCFKCWSYGHTKAECSGVDRENLCLKCGKEGHKAIDCKNKPYCIHCGIEGHQSGSLRCPKNNSRKKAETPLGPLH